MFQVYYFTSKSNGLRLQWEYDCVLYGLSVPYIYSSADSTQIVVVTETTARAICPQQQHKRTARGMHGTALENNWSRTNVKCLTLRLTWDLKLSMHSRVETSVRRDPAEASCEQLMGAPIRMEVHVRTVNKMQVFSTSSKHLPNRNRGSSDRWYRWFSAVAGGRWNGRLPRTQRSKWRVWVK